MSKFKSMLGESFQVLAPIAIIATGIGGFLVFGQRPEKPPREINHNAVSVVETAEIRKADGRFTIEIDGVALSYRQVTHAAEVAGRVTEKVRECRPGRYVDAGKFLLEIDPTNYKIEVERLQAQVEQADENLNESDVEVQNTESMIELSQEELKLQQQNLDRVKRLIAQGASTDTQLDSARMQELSARNSSRTLENQLRTVKQRKRTLQAARRLAQTQLKRAEADVARTRVSSPMSGTLITVEVEEGDYVKSGDPLFRVNDTATMEVSCQLRVEELYWVWLHAATSGSSNSGLTAADHREAQFELPSVPVEIAYSFRDVEYLWDGVLSRYDGTGLDPATRTIPCRVRVDEPTKVRVGGDGVAGAIAPPTLFSGMYVKVRIPIHSPLPMLRIPLPAVRPGGEVWVVRDGTLAVLPTEVSRIEGDSALLRLKPDGPRAGERVIISPLAAVESGMPVEDISMTGDADTQATERTGEPPRKKTEPSGTEASDIKAETETAATNAEVQP